MKEIDRKSIETLRFLSADGVQKANSGHPGLPMGAATMAYALWKEFLKGSAMDPTWVDRDRFILSAGHGSMLLYALLHLFGYEVSMEDLKSFRQLNSITPGHPEYGMTPGVETTTGPLGQGISNAVGFAIAESHLGAEFNTEDFKIIDHYTYVLAGDGDLMEGVSSEACSLAGHLKLGKLIVLYDDNGITIDGPTTIAFTEDVGKRFEAYGWQVLEVLDGNDYGEIIRAIAEARNNEEQPSLIKVKTIIGFGSPGKAGKSEVHGSPLGEEELRKTKEKFGWDADLSFYVPEDVLENFRQMIEKREEERCIWEDNLESYFQKYPEKMHKWKLWHMEDMTEQLIDVQKIWDEFNKEEATRISGGRFLNLLKEHLPNLIGGSADLNASTMTYLKDSGDFTSGNRLGKNISFGVREHAMGAILNGLALHGGLRPFGSTFLVFSDYMKPAIRLAALMKLPVIYVFTHDSIGLGEDGPTHQPIEQLMMLRLIPDVAVFRPADCRETVVAWLEAIKRKEGPSALILSRQKLKPLEGVNRDAHFGGYILLEEPGDKLDLIILATGSEVSIAVQAAINLQKEGVAVRVVSMLSWELFESQPESYQNNVLPPEVKKRISVEAGQGLGWEHFVGREGKIMGMDGFGKSGPAEELMKYFEFTPEDIEKAAWEMLAL